MIDDIKHKLVEIDEKLTHLRGYLDVEDKTLKMNAIQDQMSEAGFWDDSTAANKVMKDMKYLKSCVDPYTQGVEKLGEMQELLEISEDDEEMLGQIEEEVGVLQGKVEKLEIQSILSGEFDQNNVILSINAGAGGTESCDWASMLLRMYQRWADLNECKIQMIDFQVGDEAGVKSVTLGIEGDTAYGYLKGEKGVHRLVRISPFDSNKRRHTSFASVDVIPEIEDDGEIEIKPDDLRIDIFRASGPGGQSVNTTDSAVRITHLPTNTVVQSQNERSQLSNKNNAMKVLRARLYELKMREQEAKLNKEYSAKQKIEWGSQIRSYVMHPYLMVKDHRTNAETGNVPKVMDGDLELFIEAYLKMKPQKG